VDHASEALCEWLVSSLVFLFLSYFPSQLQHSKRLLTLRRCTPATILSALSGGQTLNDVTISGTARRSQAPTTDPAPLRWKALTTGEARMDLSFPSGLRNEVVGLSNKCLAELGAVRRARSSRLQPQSNDRLVLVLSAFTVLQLRWKVRKKEKH